MIDRITSRLEMKREIATIIRHLSHLEARPMSVRPDSSAAPENGAAG
jgi:hypothetical protein